MDRRQHDYAAPSGLPYAQQQVPNFQQQQQQQQFGFHPQHQQYPPPPMNASNFMPPHPSMQQQFPYQQQLHHPPHPQMFNQQHPPHHHHLPPPFPGPYDSAPPPPPPADPELQKRIDKLVEYSVKNGPEFEAMMRDRQKDNPDYAFLFGGEGHGYYRYKQFISMHHPPGGPFDPQFPSPSMPMMHPPQPNPMMSPGALGVQPIRQPPFPPFHDHQQQHHLPQPHPFAPPPPHARPDFDQSVHAFRGLSGPLPADVAVELNSVLANLNGTKDSIKSAKIWFMQRSPFAPALAEALRDRVFATDDSEKQMHIVYLANDILFDSLQRRANLHEFDNEALAFRPVLGSMLGKIYHCPHNKEANQSRLENLLQFWASKEVFDQDTISTLDKEMRSGPPPSTFSRSPIIAANSLQHPGMMQQPQSSHVPSTMNLEHLASNPVAGQQFIPNAITPGAFPGSIPSVPPPTQPPAGEKQAPYPLFPPGLIPGMVRKMQVGSGVPYSPLSPLDIPTVIPPSVTPQSQVLERVSKFFKEIGEVNPSEGPMGSESQDDYDDYERDSPVRKGGACIPPPANLQVDPETGTYADGSTDKKSSGYGHGRGRPIQSDPISPPFSSFVKPDSHSVGRGRGSLGSDPVSPFSPEPPRHSAPPQPQQPRFESQQPRFESQQPRYEPQQPRFESQQPRFETQQSRFEPQQPRFEPAKDGFQGSPPFAKLEATKDATSPPPPGAPNNIANALGSGAGRGKPFVQNEDNRHIQRSPQPPPQRQKRAQPPKDTAPRPQLSPEEAGRRARSQLSRGEAAEGGGGGVRGRGGGRGRGRGARGRGRGRGGEGWRDDKKEEEAEQEALSVFVGDSADGEKFAKKMGDEIMAQLADGYEDICERALPSTAHDALVDAYDTNLMIECEPEYLMPDFGSNPDIDEKPPMPLRECLEKVKPFIVALEGIKDQEEWEEAIEEVMAEAPRMKQIVDHYSGPDRVTAKKQNEELDRIATTLPQSAPDSVKRFADRVALSLKSNPGWGFDKKYQFMDKLVLEVSQNYK